MTASETVSLSENRRSSLNACLRFLSADSCTWLLRSHVLNLSTVDFMEPDNDLPDASLFMPPITVARPISCIVMEVGLPVLLLLSFSSLEKDLDSGPASTIFSFITKPQLLQKSSPLELSITISLLPHLGHLSSILSDFSSLEKLMLCDMLRYKSEIFKSQSMRLFVWYINSECQSLFRLKVFSSV